MRRVATALLVAATVLAAGATPAAATSTRFSILPARSGAGSFFSFALAPGASVEDAVVVRNDGDEPLELVLYAADGITATNGGTSFTGSAESRHGTRSWLATGTSAVSLGPGASRTVPFRVQVPSDARPGEHVAGWVVEAPPRAAGGPGISAQIVQRAGVAVVVRVPGDARAELALGELCLNQQSGSNYFQVVAANRGALIARASGTFVLAAAGREIFRRPVEIGAVLPRDSTFLRLDAPLEPGPGRYEAALELVQSDGTPLRFAARIEVGEVKANGCERVDAAPAPREPTRAVAQIAPPERGAPTALLIGLGLAGGVLIGALVAAGAFVVARKRAPGR